MSDGPAAQEMKSTLTQTKKVYMQLVNQPIGKEERFRAILLAIASTTAVTTYLGYRPCFTTMAICLLGNNHPTDVEEMQDSDQHNTTSQ